jgi:hypothetical protein
MRSVLLAEDDFQVADHHNTFMNEIKDRIYALRQVLPSQMLRGNTIAGRRTDE